MASGALNPVYFPNVKKCLAGELLLLSWDDLFDALFSLDQPRREFATKLLSGQHTQEILDSTFPSFPPPSASSKSAFDSQISAIPTSSDGQFNRDELKEDALWLSKQVNLEEQEALRLTILEWQYRSESRLREGFSPAEVASLKDALGSDFVDRNFQGRGSSLARDEAIFNSRNARRARLIRKHLEQEILLLRLARDLLDVSLLSGTGEGSLPQPRGLSGNLGRRGRSALAKDIENGVRFIRAQLRNLESARSWELDEPDLSLLKDVGDTASLQTISVVLEILLLRLRSSEEKLSSETILLWLRLMSSVGFFASFDSQTDVQRAAIQKIQSTASLVSLSLLNLGSTVAILNETASSGQAVRHSSQGEYFFDLDCAFQIHELLVNEAATGNIQAGPAILAWAIVVHQIKQLGIAIKENRESHHVQRTIDGVATFDAATGRRSSSGSASSFQPTIFEELLDRFTTLSTNEDPSIFLLNAAIDQCHIVEYITLLTASAGNPSRTLAIYKFQTIQELIAVSQSFLGYTPELVSSQLAVLSASRENSYDKKVYDPATEFIEDNLLMEGFFETAAARFPYECLPFLRFCRTLAKAPIFSEDGTPYVEFRLRRLVTFTQAAIKGIEYKTTREDEIGSFVALNKPVNVLDLSQNKLLTYAYQDSETTSIIPAGAIGELISDPDASPKVIRWQHEFSGLAYMGQLLELRYTGLLASALTPFEDPEAVVSEIIDVLTTLLSTVLSSTSFGQSADQVEQRCASILDEASSNLTSETDIVLYIFDILEQELQAFRRRSASVFDCRIMTSCTHFIHVLTKIKPHLIWSNLNRTSLLGHHAAPSPILGIVTVVEAPLGHFDFLDKCTDLYGSLINLALRDSPHGLSSVDGASARNSTISTAWRVQSNMLLAATEIMFQVFQEISDWSFQEPAQQVRISTSIADSFHHILRYAFEYGLSICSFNQRTMPFVGSAKYLVASFRLSGPEDAAMNPITRLAFIASTINRCVLAGEGVLDRYVSAVLSLASLLVRYGQSQDLPLSMLERRMFDAVPCLVRTLQNPSSVRNPCLTLLRSVLGYVERHQASSLLGHLGSSSCIDFVNLVRHLDQKSESPEERAELWKLLTLLVKDSQQWLAMVILTGAAPDNSKRPKSGEAPTKHVPGPTFLQFAMREMKDTSRLPRIVLKAMLDFAQEAQQNWSWVTKDLSSSDEFFSTIVLSVTGFDPKHYDEIDVAQQNLIAARVTDIATTHLHHVKVARDFNAVKTFLPLVNWLTSHAVDVSSYNSSLHANLRRNFAAKYNGLTVSDVKRTGLTERDYGPSFFYDLQFAGELLAKDSYWHGGQGTPTSQSFSAEFRRANMNLSAVDSELAMLSSLKRLCVDHCKFFVQDREIQKAMAQIARKSLQANCRIYPSEVLFESLFQTRADLVIVLLRELVAFGVRGSEFAGLLGPAWDAVRFRNGSYEQAIINNDLTYWRSILSILLLTIEFHVKKKRKPTMIPGSSTAVITLDHENVTFLEITSTIMADGFKSAVLAIQDQRERRLKSDDDNDKDDSIGPRDILLLLTLMQTILRLPSLPQFSVELSERLSSSGIISVGLLLYSWSHLLTRSEGDIQPRYAEYSVQLLASISSLPSVAEELAIEGVLNRILSSKTSESLQSVPGGASHADNRPNCEYLYRLWAKGFLPLCLNLLYAVGGAIAPEISAFLNRFPNQLIRASTSVMLTPQTANDETYVLTLTATNEAATLALISRLLSSFRDAGASAAVDPTTVLPLKGYDEHRKAISEDLRDLVAMKEEARRKLTVPTNEREVSWQNAKEGNILDAKIVQELKIALAALGTDDDQDEK
ncbi:uncharacterized protein Z520_04715 [Fonsecaea multimorphosa CBS 102226]|uniref:Nucleoporin NUP188 n=1 Tax=Fonsecaea multimorphosa CBS 102226 TaxID=1442371 RepID=A0A0D2K7J1_9EURO|nr:uncharacterized protein Z520_04715 [Fonsecaea multimorphosa CBS 102226]KIX99139.1 hypothetical protein Z520_04715 [Fonsecaea multimorphosa CBS 102226]OAL26051.1 hypothetical protein AYO22_04465 [Fonsecaea multimorphosa]